MTISDVRFTDDGRATVEVSTGRRDFAAITDPTLELIVDSWIVVDLSVIVIS